MRQSIVFKKKKTVVNTQQEHKLQDQIYQDPRIGSYKLKCAPGDVIISQDGQTTGLFRNVFINKDENRIFHKWPEFIISCYTPEIKDMKPFVVLNSADDECYNWPGGYRFATEDEAVTFFDNIYKEGYVWDCEKKILYRYEDNSHNSKSIKFKKEKKIIWDVTHGFISE